MFANSRPAGVWRIASSMRSIPFGVARGVHCAAGATAGEQVVHLTDAHGRAVPRRAGRAAYRPSGRARSRGGWRSASKEPGAPTNGRAMTRPTPTPLPTSRRQSRRCGTARRRESRPRGRQSERRCRRTYRQSACPFGPAPDRAVSMISVPEADDVAERGAADAPLELCNEIVGKPVRKRRKWPVQHDAHHLPVPRDRSLPGDASAIRPYAPMAPAAAGRRVSSPATSGPGQAPAASAASEESAWRCCRRCCSPGRRTRRRRELADADAVEHDEDDAGEGAVHFRGDATRSNWGPIARWRWWRWRA